MRQRFAVKILCFVLIMLGIFCSTAAAAGNVKLVIDGKQAGNAVKIINGKTYIDVDSLSALNNVTVKKGSQSIDISTTNASDIISKVGSSVVGIIGKLKESSADYNEQTDNLVFGTGVIYRSDGYIITNAHVVKDMDTIVVVLSNSKPYKARLKAIDEDLDLAEIKIDKGGLTPAKFGDIKDVTVGEEVFAIGTPLSFNLRNSATHGIISGINRTADGDYRFIQSDTAINGGNSGGPLVNMRGEVIGINSVKFIGFGVEGMSFSIPIDTVKYAIKQFESFGRIRMPYLGLTFTESIAAKYGLPTYEEGLTIRDIQEDSPATKYDIQTDDKLMSVNGVKVNTIIDYNEEMKKYLPGNKATLKIMRNNKLINLEVVFGEKR